MTLALTLLFVFNLHRQLKRGVVSHRPAEKTREHAHLLFASLVARCWAKFAQIDLPRSNRPVNTVIPVTNSWPLSVRGQFASAVWSRNSHIAAWSTLLAPL